MLLMQQTSQVFEVKPGILSLVMSFSWSQPDQKHQDATTYNFKLQRK